MVDKVGNWSTTAASNTSVAGVFIGENCPYANMNDAARETMAAVRYEVASFGANVSAAGVPDIGSLGGVLSMLGVTTVTGFATAPSGVLRVIHWETATPVVPGASLDAPFTSLTTTKGGVMALRSLGSGNWKVEYSSDYLQTRGKHKLWIPAAAMTPAATNGAAAGSFVGSSNAQNLFTLDFDQTTNEIAFFNLGMPSSWDEGTVTFRPVWTAASGSGDVSWVLDGTAYSDDDALDAAFGTPAGSIDTLLTAGDLHRSPESSAITIAGSPAANDLVNFRVRRSASGGPDTLNADAQLIGIELYITTDAAVDVA